ncbi:hypothetical protein [uncultured Deinococcus sp.]|uniref:hypothetical protein n=1 Tax=uncultured Deinococcus sp. TaxID=158789 RepID=UPI0025E1AE8A|nr:hypothetical protein [uncultured Deinococcus sp.]
MKRIILLATALTAGLSWAGAQTWDTRYGTYTLKGCYTSAGAVRCDFGYVYTQDGNQNLQVNPRLYEAVGADGKTYKAKQVSVGGQPLSTNTLSQQFYKGVSVPISVVFDAPPTATVFQVVALQDVAVNNIPVRGAAAPLPPVVKTPATTTQPAGVPTGFTMRLSNCKVTSGVYICTATLTPTR